MELLLVILLLVNTVFNIVAIWQRATTIKLVRGSKDFG